MISFKSIKSHVYFSKQLNFGEQIHFQRGIDVSVMKITLSTYISLIKRNTRKYAKYAESEEVTIYTFL